MDLHIFYWNMNASSSYFEIYKIYGHMLRIAKKRKLGNFLL